MECRWLETFPLLVIASFCRKIEHKFDRLEVFGYCAPHPHRSARHPGACEQELR